MSIKDDGVLRSFETGATRDTAEGKLDFEGFLHPLFLEQFAKYMNMHRLQSDGKLRDSDNWQKGIPQDVCMKSLWRHFFEMWKAHRGYGDQHDLIAAAMGMMFNIQAYVLQDIMAHGVIDFDGCDPTDEMRERQERIAYEQKEAKRLERDYDYYAYLGDLCCGNCDECDIAADCDPFATME